MRRHAMLVSLCLTLSACALDAEAGPRCEAAATGISSCTGIDREAAFELCLASTEDEAIEHLGRGGCEVDLAAGPKADLAQDVFVGVCMSTALAGRVVMDAVNEEGRALPRDDAQRLAPHFGDSVDRAVVTWNAQLPDEWIHSLGRIADDWVFDGEGGRIGAQTLGSHIYVTHAYDPADTQQRRTVTHEMTHVRQAEEAGGLVQFFAAYCEGFYLSGFSYEHHPMEVEAREMERIVHRD